MLVSIGYKSLPVAGLPFDARSGTVPNVQGRVVAASGAAGGQNGGGVSADRSGSSRGATASTDTASSEAAGSFEPGLYVCGWLKRGPTGIIGTNLVSSRHCISGTFYRAGGGWLDDFTDSGGLYTIDHVTPQTHPFTLSSTLLTSSVG